MKIMFILTVDTEEEWEWEGEFPKGDFRVKNISKIPKFQSFCDERGVRPTYLVDHAVVNSSNVEYLIKPFREGKCEIGAHLHPWCTPPVEEEINDMTSHIVNLPPALVRRKVRNLISIIEEKFGERPRSFRSGRWGITGLLLKMLAEEGLVIDSSVFPYYKDDDFSYYEAPDVPYWPDFEECARKGEQREIFEIPVTSGFNHSNFELCHEVQQILSSRPWKRMRLIGILWRLGLFRKLYLSPEGLNGSDMISCVKACLSRGHKVIHMFLHSSSLLVGASPYVKTEVDERRFYNNMGEVIDYIKTNTDVSFCTLSDAKEKLLQEAY